MSDETIVIADKDKILAFREVAFLHGWRQAAHMKVEFGMTSARFPTIKKFNEQYGVKARTWTQVHEVCDSVIKELRAEMREGK